MAAFSLILGHNLNSAGFNPVIKKQKPANHQMQILGVPGVCRDFSFCRHTGSCLTHGKERRVPSFEQEVKRCN